MIAAIRNSKLVLGGLLVLVGSVVLCPHTTHEPVCEEPEAAADHDSGHDHGHCEFDTSHSHDFRVSSDQNLLAPPAVTALVALDLLLPASIFWAAIELELPDGPLQQLGTVRLLI